MSKCIILGAGASLGYDESLKGVDKPPKTNSLFKNGYLLRLFTQEKYPRLYENLKSYQKTKYGLTSENLLQEFDVEAFLGWIGDRFEYLLAKLLADPFNFPIHERDELNSYQTALGESWFYLFEIMGFYSRAYKHNSNSYAKLAKYCLNENYSVISLNYDVLFEQAIQTSGLKYDYKEKQSDAISIAKIHGSINWLNSGRGGFGFANVNSNEIFSRVTNIIFSNKIQIHAPQIMELSDLPNLTTEKLLRSGTDYDIPILVPPIGKFKPYADSDFLNNVKKYAQNLFVNLDDLVLIGTTLRKEDTFLCNLVKSSVKQSTRIVIVTHNTDEVKKRLKEILGWDAIFELCHDFNEFASKL